MKFMDIRNVDANDLVDINDVQVNTKLSMEERVEDFVRQIKNPYCYRCGDMVIKVSFAGKKSIEDAVREYIQTSAFAGSDYDRHATA